ncbi:MAG: hypothetical protein MJ002_07305 [Paludibacteraceae bacterium]|nr:hypothetical protein [Paludibacteraceae bacterium]
MTYNPGFEDMIRKLPEWINTPVSRLAIVYSGDFENLVGQVALVNYRNPPQLLNITGFIRQ